MIAIVEAWKTGLFKRHHLLPNIISGLIVAIVALPLSIAFAIASGFKPEQGIYTSIIAGLLVSIFGGSRLQIAGPSGAFILILSDINLKYGMEGLQIMAGMTLILLGCARLGSVIKYIPNPVILGYTAGVGALIWVGQWRDFLGLPKVVGDRFHEKLWFLFQALPDFHWITTALAVLSILLVIYGPRLPGLKKIPGPLLAMLIVTCLQTLFQFDNVATLGSAFGGIPSGLPSMQLPYVSWSIVINLIEPAFAITMLCAIESLLSAVISDGIAGTKHHSNQELLGQGLANIMSPLFSGFAATGAIARTATNIRNGGSSPLAGIVHVLILFLMVQFLAPFAANIPLCALAGILFVVAYNMSQIKHFVRMTRRAPVADILVLWVTFLLTVFADLIVAVNIGVTLAILNFLRRMSSSVSVEPIAEGELTSALSEQENPELPDGVLVYSIEGPFFFGAAESFEHVLNETHTDPRILIIRLGRVPFIDMTGLQALEDAIKALKKRHVEVILCEAKPIIKKELQKAGLIEQTGQYYFQELGEALCFVTQLSEQKPGRSGVL